MIEAPRFFTGVSNGCKYDSCYGKCLISNTTNLTDDTILGGKLM